MCLCKNECGCNGASVFSSNGCGCNNSGLNALNSNNGCGCNKCNKCNKCGCIAPTAGNGAVLAIPINGCGQLSQNACIGCINPYTGCFVSNENCGFGCCKCCKCKCND